MSASCSSAGCRRLRRFFNRHLAVNLGERDARIGAVKMACAFETDKFREQPMSTGLAAEHLRLRIHLRHQRVFLQPSTTRVGLNGASLRPSANFHSP